MAKDELKTLDQKDNDRQFRLERMEQHQKEMEEISSQITKITLEIKDQKECLKKLKSELKELQSKLLSKALRGVPDQITIELHDAPQHCEEVKPDWWESPISSLELSTSDGEKLAQEFDTCGEVCEWLGTDNRRKIKGFGEKFQEKLREAIDKKAGVFISDATNNEKPVNDRFVEKEQEEVDSFIEKLEWLLDDLSYKYAHETLEGIYNWVSEHQCYTSKQLLAVDNIENHQSYSDWR